MRIPELRLPSGFTYETQAGADAFMQKLRPELLTERVLVLYCIRTGRRLGHSLNMQWGAIRFTRELTDDGMGFLIKMVVHYGSNKAASGISSFYTVGD